MMAKTVLGLSQRRAYMQYINLRDRFSDVLLCEGYSLRVQIGNIPVRKDSSGRPMAAVLGGTRRVGERAFLVQFDEKALGLGFGSKQFGFGSMLDSTFVDGVGLMFHEFGHVNQYIFCDTHDFDTLEDYDDAVKLSKFQVMAFQNEVHYLDHHDAYFHELDANEQAVSDTYDFLCDMFPNVGSQQVEQLVVDYANRKILRRGSPVVPVDGERFSSLSEVSDAFAVAKLQCGSVYLPYFDRNCHDEVAQAFHLNRIEPSWYPIMRKFLHADTGMQQVDMAVSLACYLHPEYKAQYPVLQTIDLSPETICGQSFPESRSKILEYLASIDADVAKGRGLYAVDKSRKPSFDRSCNDLAFRDLEVAQQKLNAERGYELL